MATRDMATRDVATRDKAIPSFSGAAARWFELSRTEIDSGDEGEALEALDQRLLRHRPSSDLESIIVMEVVAEAMRGGGRCDGLDVSALLNIRDRLLRESRETGLGSAFAALQPPEKRASSEHRLSATG